MTIVDHITNFLEPKIYVVCEASRKKGFLHGVWIDATQPIKVIHEKIIKMLKNSPEPFSTKWRLHDYEDFGLIRLDEKTHLGFIIEVARFIARHGELGAALITYHSDSVQLAKKAFEGYCGEYYDQADFVKTMLRTSQKVSNDMEYYIDYKRLVRDLFISDYYGISLNGQYHVFHSVRQF